MSEQASGGAMRAFGWIVLAGVFGVEVLAFAAFGVVGYRWAGTLGAIGAVVVVIALWALVASPRARWRHRIATPIVKALVFAGAAAGLALTGSVGLGVGLLVLAAVLNGLARLPVIRALTTPG